MPNWCQNSVLIRVPEGKSEVIRDNILGAFDDDGRWKELSFERLIPQPKFEDINKPGVFPDWYEWRTEHWGTKWDACEVEIDEGAGLMNIQFDTAWGPPLPWMYKLLEKLNEIGIPDTDVRITYIEFGGGFYGKIENGFSEEGSVTDDVAEEFKQQYGAEYYF